MTHASTSLPSAETAVKRSSAESSRPEQKAPPTEVRRRSSARPSPPPAGRRAAANSSSSAVAVFAVNTSRPPATSKPDTQRSPPTTSAGGAEPSAATRYTCVMPRSSTVKRMSPPSHTGSRDAGYGSQLRSSASVSRRTSPLAASTVATCMCLGSSQTAG